MDLIEDIIYLLHVYFRGRAKIYVAREKRRRRRKQSEKKKPRV